MLREFEIKKDKVPTAFIGEDGNVHFHTETERFFLKNTDGETISREYYCIICLGDDHFAVCDVINSITFFSDYNYYDIVGGNYEMATPKIKWGIMRVNRDQEGKIIPRAETMVVPCMYDRISENNLKTATAYMGDKLTYLDLDRNRTSYGKQLVPCILDHAVTFNVSYEGFAECSVNGIVGFIPRNCKIKKSIEGDELLTKSQTLCLFKYLNGSDSDCLDAETISSYFNLTGEKPDPKKGQLLKRTRNSQ